MPELFPVILFGIYLTVEGLIVLFCMCPDLFKDHDRYMRYLFFVKDKKQSDETKSKFRKLAKPLRWKSALYILLKVNGIILLANGLFFLLLVCFNL
jgi:hypothetical protein